MSVENAGVMAKLLVQTGLHCVFSHGTKQLTDCIRMICEGKVNPSPGVEVLSESNSALVLDGNGGMGHLPYYFGTQQTIAEAKKHGCATLTTRNHYHFGAGGKYTRIALEHNCTGIAMSSHRISWSDHTIAGRYLSRCIQAGVSETQVSLEIEPRSVHCHL